MSGSWRKQYQKLMTAVATACSAFIVTTSLSAADAESQTIEFNRDIRPILSDKCFTCHGPDDAQRQADLRLDRAENAYALLGDHAAIKPGSPDESLLIARVTSGDLDMKMPPVDSGLSLTADEIEKLSRWIEQGAKYEKHWSFQPVVRPAVPQVKNNDECQNAIDYFVINQLEDRGFAPSQQADSATLVRRVYLDLLGVPPSVDDIDAFTRDKSPAAYESMVDRLLADPRYGERWGRHWLDQARYADTNGYTIDSARSMWPYRDWVIAALNADMPFDQFTVEQIAGDLLPDATQDQLIATGFHRNTLINQEGGTDDEQFRNETVVDRVSTTGAVWLGLTIGCAQCHSHKFDPITQKDFYQLFAFFNSTRDVNNTGPVVKLPTEMQEKKLAELAVEINKAKKELADYDASQKKAADQQKEADDEGKKSVKPEDDPNRQPLAKNLKSLESARAALLNKIATTMVMKELEEPRPTHIHIRGDFLRKGDPVQPDTPATLFALSETKEKRSRIDLARWLVSRQNPLTARVTVNRIWMRYFGRGLVETENDFGMQGTLPTHPKLLDWLSAEFMEQGWSLKHIHRLIVTSATYRQASHYRADLAEIDPLNKLLARQNRLRVDAELVRDMGLAASGLMTNKLGGPSVYPPQPAGVYLFTQSQMKWSVSMGADRYRRGLYTFFRRSAPYPMLTTFDTPRFNTACTRRNRSNTPLQSLTMANDQTMIEIAAALGKRLLTQPANNEHERIEYAYRLCFSRKPSPDELTDLGQFVESQRSEFTSHPDDAKSLLADDTVSANEMVETATWVAVARVLINLDEFITRE